MKSIVMASEITTDQKRVFEQYAFYRLASMDMDAAHNSLHLWHKNKNLVMRDILFRDAVISYMRPFSGSKGIYGGGYKISDKDVPVKYLKLHGKLDSLRNQLFAHTDITARKPGFTVWGFGRGAPPMTFKGDSYNSLYRQIHDIWELVVGVKKNIDVRLDRTLTACKKILGYSE
jgi:hypothetical protein